MVKSQEGQLWPTTRATYLSDVSTGQTVVASSELLVTSSELLVTDVRSQTTAVHGAGVQDGLMASWVWSSSRLD